MNNSVRGNYSRLPLAMPLHSIPVRNSIKHFFFKYSLDADKPNLSQRTLGLAGLSHKEDPDELNLTQSAHLEEAKLFNGEHSLRVKIISPITCPVTEWKLEIDTKLYSGGALSYRIPESIFILFNPWVLKDQVYLSDEEQRYEYVMEQQGLIWRGSAQRFQAVPWVYAQFERDVLECSMYIVSKLAKVNARSRGDPVRLVRALSAAVNSPDDNGALVGFWGSDFGKYTAPTKWMGSMKILQAYLKTKKPVKYGQCWVFAGVLNTSKYKEINPAIFRLYRV